MPDREKVIDELIMLKRFIPSTMWEPINDAIALLKEQEEKPLLCNKCSYHRADGWCGMHERWVKETDYCSLGAWECR
ncbi:MAG: hypothetical protein IKE94_16480 [Aeriscardovia sp.]|nr:hypothetical protein [Aeriscardovia sp.]